MSKIIDDPKKRIAVVLFNLGGPDKKEAVKPFLFNLFNDKYIITLPCFLRFFIAKIISSKREKFAQKIYAHTGNKSPILEQTMNQKKNLEMVLAKNKNIDFNVFICMRHWHPMTDEVVVEIEKYKPDEVIMLPLYPQFSTTTTASSFEEFTKKLKNKDSINIKSVCCYPTDENFINSHVDLIEKSVAKLEKLNEFRMIFSAHGLPEKIVKKGDPYQWQVGRTVEKIVKKLLLKSKFKNLDYKIAYQSRIGPLKWIGPNTEDEIKLAGEQKTSIVIVPIAFVSEHVETLVELDIEYKEIADLFKIDYIRVPTLSVNNIFIKSLSLMIENMVKTDAPIITSSKFKRICPKEFSKCPCA